NLTVDASAGAFATIGNGSLGGDVTGDVQGTITVTAADGGATFTGEQAWLGNTTGGDGKASGDVTIVSDLGGVPAAVLAADLGTSADTGGDVFFGFTHPEEGTVVFTGLTYDSPPTFTLAS